MNGKHSFRRSHKIAVLAFKRCYQPAMAASVLTFEYTQPPPPSPPLPLSHQFFPHPSVCATPLTQNP
ncbi:hypothetical protein M0802_009654 [Mischocyttarus mexicanus]|nr:hypothetical protein M0802_009654 [Mischocyttarus mexicanus]